MHAYICECERRDCRRRVYLTPTEYKRLSRFGAVLDLECYRRTDRKALASSYTKTAFAVQTQRLILNGP